MRRRSSSVDRLDAARPRYSIGSIQTSDMLARAKPIISSPISATWSTNGRLRAMNSAISARAGAVCLWRTTRISIRCPSCAEIEDPWNGFDRRRPWPGRRSRGGLARRRRSGCRPSCSGCRSRPRRQRSPGRRSVVPFERTWTCASGRRLRQSRRSSIRSLAVERRLAAGESDLRDVSREQPDQFERLCRVGGRRSPSSAAASTSGSSGRSAR